MGVGARTTRQDRYAPDRGNVARPFALLFGLGYVVIGVAGFAVTGFTGFVAETDEKLLGFDLNIFHNVVHLAIGASLMLVSRARDVTVTQGVLIGVGLFYLLAAVLGFANSLQLISIDDALAADNFLHLFSGLAAFAFGVIGAFQQRDSMQRARAEEGPRPIEERREMWAR